MFTISDDLELRPAKCGCEGCFFEDADTCPGSETLDNCSLGDRAMIFIKKEDTQHEQ